MNCTHCGAALSPDDVRLPACRYCGTALAHHVQTAQQVAAVQALMGDRNGNGIPDALEGMFPPGMVPPRAMPPGMGAAPHGHAIVSGHVVVLTGQSPPPYGGPMAGPPPYGGSRGFTEPQHVAKLITAVVVGGVLLVLGLVAVGIAVAFVG